MKKGYHSTQKKYFNTMPRTAFLGFVGGYGLGLLFSGIIRTDSQTPHWLFAVIGAAIGYWIDHKYFLEKDLSVEEIEAQIAEEEAAEAAAELGEGEEEVVVSAVEPEADEEPSEEETEE